MKNTHSKSRYIVGILVLLMTVATSYLVYTHPNLNMAALYNAVVTGENSSTIYLPAYEADMGEEGVIEIKSKANTDPFDSLSFIMNFDPIDALSFESDAILLDNQTLLKNVTVKTATLKQPGSLEVTLILEDPVSVSGVTTADSATHKTLFKLNTLVDDNLMEGQKVNLSFKDFAVSDGDVPLNFPVIPPSTLTIKIAEEDKGELENTTITSVAPQSISNTSDSNVTLTGKGLDLVKEVWVGTEPATILNQSATSLSVKVMAGLKPEKYDLVLFDKDEKSVSFNDQLTVTDSEVGDEEQLPGAPKIIIDRSYTNPTAAINDGKTPLTLYTFVQDEDIKSVIANLTHIGQVGAENGGVLGQEKDEDLKTVTCPSDSNVIVCMKPSVKEGNGQWFILSDITVSKSVVSSQTPYEVAVLVLDEEGNTREEMIPVYVGEEANIAAPKALVAVPTSETTVEILFNKEMDSASISPAGADFSVSTVENPEKTLTITKATLDASGKIVTLTTAPQEANANYILSVSEEVKDMLGKGLVEAENNNLSFEGFVALNKSPLVDYISTLDTGLLELEFQAPLKLSSILALEMKIYEADDLTKELEVKNIKLLSSNLIQVETQQQVPDQRYRITIEGLMSYDGTALPVPINKGFKGHNTPLVHHAATARKADLNGDNRIDFSDFTIFSSVYGTVYEGEEENLSETVTTSE